MEVHIIRGQNQIGGSIIEVCSSTTKIILETGSELGEKTPIIPKVDGLFQGKPLYDAVLITHYHGDHIGLLESVLSEIPVYMGEKAFHIYQAANGYLNKPVISPVCFFHAGEEIDIGDIKVVPLLCDHSAFDSYMLLLSSEGKTMLYTGDFRANGRKHFPSLLKRLPKIDILITEGTTLSRPHLDTLTEQDLEENAIRCISKLSDEPVFIFMAATNIDRLVTMYRIAKRTQRIFLEDVYTATIASAAGDNIPNPQSFCDVKTFLTAPTEKQYAILQRYDRAKIGRAEISKKRFIMCVRPSMKAYLEKLNNYISFQGGCLFYSMWDGYMANEDVSGFLQYMKEKGVSIEQLHTSGHADMETIDRVIEQTKPRYILPVHTENANWFERYKTCKVIYESKYLFL